ncbi:MAG: hypothetical protein FJ144_08005 [Deltaproteobacteria bacterium]|nr:hypothetical protein [Deltaproteobacteria bacterium]
MTHSPQVSLAVACLLASGFAAAETPAPSPDATKAAAAAQTAQAAQAAHGTHAAHDHAAFARHVDAALLEKPIGIEKGLGKVHQKVGTESSEAQTYHDQGLANLHAYQWIRAARSFHEALRRDSNLALARIGLARAYEGMKDEAAADRELARAQELAPKASAREQKYVAAYAAKRRAVAAAEADREATLAAYKKILDELTAEDASDAEAWLLRGNAEESAAGRGQNGDETTLRFYEAALRASPDHFGAHHYVAHTYENVGRADDAVKHAEIFSRACPDVPHARHMFAHTLPRVGRWKDAVAELEAADVLEENAEREDGIPRAEDWHRVHNLNLLGLAYLHRGRTADAERTLREAYETPIPDPLAQSWHSTWPEFLLVQGRPQEALAVAKELEESDSPVKRAIGSALVGEAMIDLGDLKGAGEQSKKARKRVDELRTAAKGHARAEVLVLVAQEYAQILDVRGALRNGPPQEWRDFIVELVDAIAEDPTFDGWGNGWVRLKRISKDARATGNGELADHIDEKLAGSSSSS